MDQHITSAASAVPSLESSYIGKEPIADEKSARSSTDNSGRAPDYDVEKSHVSETTVASTKRLTVTFRNVSVIVNGVGAEFADTVGSLLNPAGIFQKSQKPPERAILSEVSGQICPGEMLLVLGRPGSGCSTLLRILANNRHSYKKVEGEVRYGSATADEAHSFRQQIIYNSEEDIHFPTLTVNETLRFALSNKVPKSKNKNPELRAAHVEENRTHILGDLGITHTGDTLVGNEYVRGVSGGERKRVSLAEVMASQSPVQLWDNSTRGLDASTALDFAKVLRRMANEERKSIVATLYQAGNGIYNEFDKVLVLDAGKVIYYGPRATAKSYFEDMGFACPPGGAVADFLTSVTVETERRIRPGFEGKVPDTADEFERRFKESSVYRDANFVEPDTLTDEIHDLKAAIAEDSATPLFGDQSVYTASLWYQVMACTTRAFQIIWGDRRSEVMKMSSAIVQALVSGSLFYNLPTNSTATFLRPGALFFPLIFFAMNALAETTATFLGRPILARHKMFALYRPTAFVISQVITDLPMLVMSISVFEIIHYFMCHFVFDAGKFFTQWVVLLAYSLCMNSYFRMIGAWNSKFGGAALVSGLSIMVFMVYAGYLLPFFSMPVWFRWLFWLNPTSYALEAFIATEYRGLDLECVAPQYVPYGPGYTDNAYRQCTTVSSQGNVIHGDAYIFAQFNYSAGHIWRSFGVLMGAWVVFTALTALGYEKKKDVDSGSRLLYKQGANTAAPTHELSKGPTREELAANMTHSVFTWRDVDYHVPFHGAQKQLLNKISGFAKPGQLLALMGTSGAGKTTLMDVLAQRKDAGTIHGSIMVDGAPRSISFQRTTGYCEQNDVHEPTATVREALLFSARLRQKYSIPDKEKVQYVDHIIDLLEMREFEDALVGVPGAGLSVEQRKRLTLAVELVARPTLLFLDEPTSGLDGQSAYNIMRFMRKLAEAGQAVVCTIHQPSATLFNAFDSLLLLAKGGRTTYFGETGEGSAELLRYFADHGAPCPADVNPAEHIIDVVQGRQGDGVDWVQAWEESAERVAMLREIDELNATATPPVEDPEMGGSFATPKLFQAKIVIWRQSVGLWRNPDYVMSKVNFHIVAALFAGFTFWNLGNTTYDMQLRLMAVFNFIFVAPGVINQMQPFYLHNRDIFETREKKSKTYHWSAFVAGQCAAETPWLILCGTLYFCCWYFTTGMPVTASISGQVYFQMVLYEFLYTSIGQSIATYAPNEYFASLANPLILGAGLINFCGVIVPYAQINVFWRYWMYYLDPFTYLVGGLLTQLLWDTPVKCAARELTRIPLPGNATCGEYMHDFVGMAGGYVVDAAATGACEYCQYSVGKEFAMQANLKEKYYAWRDTGITALFCISSYMLVFGMMKLRTKKAKKEE
ncbi:putative ABC multidrug transporter [Trichodelitschia bisporula]|uniref:Putative ABC multidrug transporter n=1 Tax=Trichodelitschia bisporula TaxID=703511 RepID=A0A6G1HRZ0_9PEZI|nr:putative ABC multidrug transporter [Trichodelitschia bisporula]